MDILKNKEKIFFGFLSLLFILPFKSKTNYIFILVFLLSSLFFINREKIANEYKINHNSISFWMPAIIVIIWVYGVLLGFINHNPIQNIIFNFAGMSIYISFYFMLLWDIKLESLVRFIVNISKVILIISFVSNIVFWEFGLSNPVFLLIKDFTHGHGINSTHYQIFHLVVFSHIIGKVFGRMKLKISDIIYLCIIIYLIFGVYDMGGFILAVVVILFFGIYFLCISNKRVIQFGVSKFTAVLIVIFLIYALIDIFSGKGIFSIVFSLNDYGNQVRIEQIVSIVSEISLFGKGLGAEFDSYVRHGVYTYGIEVTYLNLFHKFGVMTFIILYSYIYIFYQSMKLAVNQNIYMAILVIGLIAYTIPSLSNPYLFHTSAVFLHILSYYIIMKVNKINTSKNNLETE